MTHTLVLVYVFCGWAGCREPETKTWSMPTKEICEHTGATIVGNYGASAKYVCLPTEKD